MATVVGSTITMLTSTRLPGASFWGKYWYYIVGGTAAAIGLSVLLVLLIILAIKARGARQSENEGRKEAQAVINRGSRYSDKQCYEGSPSVNFAPLVHSHPMMTEAPKFKEEVTRVNGLRRSAVAAYVESCRYKQPVAPEGDEEMKRILAMEFVTRRDRDQSSRSDDRMKRPRHPQYEIIETSQAPVIGQHIKEKDHNCLHANIMYDLYGSEFIVSQTPSKELVDYHWEMIWQRRVGVIVWVGPTGLGKNDIDPYLSLVPGVQSNYGRFDVKTVSAVAYQRMYKMYTLSVRNKDIFTTVDSKGQENREMYVIHIDPWPKTRRRVNAPNMALTVEMVRMLSLQQGAKAMPSILAHCGTGLEKSCTFFGIYLCRQVQMRFNAVNVRGILHMIEHDRYKAFAADKVFDQIQVLHAVVREFCEHYPSPRILAGLTTSVDALIFERHVLGYKPRHAVDRVAVLECAAPKKSLAMMASSRPAKSLIGSKPPASTRSKNSTVRKLSTSREIAKSIV